jgi:beta-1,4-mannosyl-glycoprotein beta-1,4-N-acetylglucosaminyltransferase
MFFNELDLLDLKIKEELPHVDKIVIVESEITHSGNPKPLNFPADKYKDNEKILYVIAAKSIFADCHGRWDKEVRQRDYAMSRIIVSDDDVYIVTDIDEIVNSENIERIVSAANQYGLVRLNMRLFFYYINVQQPGYVCPHPYAVTGKIYKKNPSLSYLRTGPDRNSGTFHNNAYHLSNCGNHFGWLGSVDKVKEKFDNFCHTEYDTPEIRAGIEERFETLGNIVGRTDQPSFVIVDIDELHPKTIRENISEWSKYIRNKEK